MFICAKTKVLFVILICNCQNTYEMNYDAQHNVLRWLCSQDYVGFVAKDSYAWDLDKHLVVFLVRSVRTIRNKYGIPLNDLFRVFMYGLKVDTDLDLFWNKFWVAGNVIQNGTKDQFWTINSSVPEAESMLMRYGAVKGAKYQNDLLKCTLNFDFGVN